MSDTLSTHYTTLIAEVDKTLSMVREFWMAARDEGEKRKNMARINELLDQRNSLMRAGRAAGEVKA